MADHSKPLITSTYSNFVTELDGRFDDLALGLDPANTTPTNLPTNSIRWSSVDNKWQKWNGTAWGNLSTLYSLTALALSTTLTVTGNTTLTGALIGDATTDSTSITTGAWQTDGGLGVVKNIWVGGNGNIAGSLTVQTDITVTGDVALNGGDLTSTATSGTIFNSNVTTLAIGNAATALSLGASSGILTLRNPNIATTVTTGSLGLFAGVTTGTINIGSANAGKLAVGFNTASSSSATGALTVVGGIGIGGVSYFGNDVFLSGTGAIKVASGTTGERPTGTAGKIRFNTTINKYEGHNGSIWSSIGGGATGGGNDDTFYENSTVITANYTITTGKNAMTAGPITINDGITVTVPDNSTWTIV